MANESLAAAVKVTRSINLLEKHGISILEEQHDLIGKLLSARRTIIGEQGKANLPISFGLAAIETASQAQDKISTAIRLVAECHKHLAADRTDARLFMPDLGDVWPCPTGEGSSDDARPTLTIVAQSA